MTVVTPVLAIRAVTVPDVICLVDDLMIPSTTLVEYLRGIIYEDALIAAQCVNDNGARPNRPLYTRRLHVFRAEYRIEHYGYLVAILSVPK